jgi:hypothetical protein
MKHPNKGLKEVLKSYGKGKETLTVDMLYDFLKDIYKGYKPNTPLNWTHQT